MAQNIYHRSCFLVLFLLVMSCAPSLNISTDYDRSVKFTDIKSFKIDTGNKIEQSVSELNQDRINNAIREVLRSKNLEEKDESDVVVYVSTILKDKVSVSSNTNYYGYGGFYRPYTWGNGISSSTNFNVDNYKEGSLIIDIIDTKTQKLIWEGIGNKEIDKPLNNPDKEIFEAVSKILSNFPPLK